MDFPDESHLPRSQDGSEPIRGGSIAINRILGMLKEKSSQKHVEWKLFLLNGETLFKNVYTEGMTKAQLKDAFLHECQVLLTYLEAYLSRYLPPDGSIKYPFVVYFPDYSAIPDDILRPLSQKELTFQALYKQVRNEFPKTTQMTSFGMYTNRYVAPVGGGTRMPHIELVLWLQRMALDGGSKWFKWGDPVFLMTNYVTDLYIHKRMKGIELIERFTGLVKLPQQFGTKILRSSERKEYPALEVPFNVATHRAFGDDLQVKPIAQRKVRADLIQLAMKNRWMTKGLDSIVRDVTSVTGVSSQELLRVHF